MGRIDESLDRADKSSGGTNEFVDKIDRFSGKSDRFLGRIGRLLGETEKLLGKIGVVGRESSPGYFYLTLNIGDEAIEKTVMMMMMMTPNTSQTYNSEVQINAQIDRNILQSAGSVMYAQTDLCIGVIF